MFTSFENKLRQVFESLALYCILCGAFLKDTACILGKSIILMCLLDVV